VRCWTGRGPEARLRHLYSALKAALFEIEMEAAVPNDKREALREELHVARRCGSHLLDARRGSAVY